MRIPAAARLVLSEADNNQLMRIGGHRSTPRGIVLRVEIVRAAAEGMANRAIARQLSTSLPTVLLWRKRYEAERLAGILEDKPRSGRPKEISANGKPRSWKPRWRPDRKTPRSRVCGPWQKCRRSAPRPCTGYGPSISCSRIASRASSSAFGANIRHTGQLCGSMRNCSIFPPGVLGSSGILAELYAAISPEAKLLCACSARSDPACAREI